jgi:hypothetical protein
VKRSCRRRSADFGRDILQAAAKLHFARTGSPASMYSVRMAGESSTPQTTPILARFIISGAGVNALEAAE